MARQRLGYAARSAGSSALGRVDAGDGPRYESADQFAARMGVPEERFRLDFFGGTMSWVRPEALRPLRELSLADAFPPETGLVDGGLEHAAGRLFATSVVAAGYRLASSDGSQPLADKHSGSATGPATATRRG